MNSSLELTAHFDHRLKKLHVQLDVSYARNVRREELKNRFYAHITGY